jgi:septal ring factor EnvC (AmiA/AmiB activator)
MDDKVVILNKTIDDKMDGLRKLITKVQHNEANIATNTNKIEQLQTTVNKLENLIESNSKANEWFQNGCHQLKLFVLHGRKSVLNQILQYYSSS